jgi:hypothetical protein
MLTQVQVEDEIWRLCALLEEAVTLHSKVIVEAAHADADAKDAYDNAMVRRKGRGTGDDRKAEAGWETRQQRRDAAVLEAQARALREKMHSIRSQLDALRTLNANLRTVVS